MANNYKLDIKEVLKNIDQKNYEWFDHLTEDQKKSFEPYVVMQFLSSGQNDKDTKNYIEVTNELLNKNFSVLSRNKELFYKLCCVCGTGDKTFHKFIKPKSNKKQTCEYVHKFLYDLYDESLTEDEVVLFVKENKEYTKGDWTDYAESLGWEDESIKHLTKEVDQIKKSL